MTLKKTQKSVMESFEKRVKKALVCLLIENRRAGSVWTPDISFSHC